MLDLELMRSVAVQMMGGNAVDIGGKVIPVKRTSSHRLRTVQFAMNGREYQAIEQNAAKRNSKAIRYNQAQKGKARRND